MPRNPNLPKPPKKTFKKSDIFASLKRIDSNKTSTKRILELETNFRAKIKTHLAALPTKSAALKKFNTSPYVLLIHSFKNNYSQVSQIEGDILPAKEFSSMETSAGRMVEEVVLPIYKWKGVPSAMHTSNSALDGMQKTGTNLKLATLKSGPRCLNDEMSENFADAIIGNAEEWAKTAKCNYIDFTYGVLYGTQKQSNKKDWHILRNIEEKLPSNQIVKSPKGIWNCSFKKEGTTVDVNIRIGEDWWTYLGNKDTLIEVAIALVRATISPTTSTKKAKFTIADIEDIISVKALAKTYNVSILQKSQFQWLLLFLFHFCDELEE